MTLTRRQNEVLKCVTRYIEDREIAPSLAEVASELGYRSVATVHEHIANLVEKGYLRKSPRASRAIELLPKEMAGTALAPSVELPLRGRIAAGLPIEAVEQEETLSVPADMVEGRGPSYVLQVEGESMIEEHICDGDFVVVRHQETAENGQVVVALVDGESATLKRLYREPDGRVRLQPANVAMDPIVVEAEDVQVQGIVVGMLRRY